jgi:hypothetical protein
MAVVVHSDATLFVAKNQAENTLASGINSAQTTIPLNSAGEFVSTGGYAWIVSTHATTPGEELISYTGISGNDLTGVTRGVGGTTPLNADAGDAVEFRVSAEMHNALKDALIATSGELDDLANGVEPFSALTLDDTQGTVQNGFTFTMEADGDLVWALDTGSLSTDLYIKGTAGTDIARLAMDGTYFGVAVDRFKGFVQDGLDDDPSSLWFDFEPEVADGSGAVAFQMTSLTDLANATASVLAIANNGTDVLNVRKLQTEAPKFKATATEVGLNLPVVAADPSAPANGDLWVKNTGGVRTLHARIAGVTYSVTLT